MRSAGLAMLQLQDSAGRILSSGHFRNTYDRVEPALPQALIAAGSSPVLVRARTADTTLLVLARVDSLRLAGARYTLVGGTAIEPRLRGAPARDPDLSVRVVEPDTPADTLDRAALVATLSLPYATSAPGAGSRAATRPA